MLYFVQIFLLAYKMDKHLIFLQNQYLFLNNDGGVESFIWEVGKYLQVLGMSLANDTFIVDVQTPHLMS